MNNEKPTINQNYPEYNYKLTPFKLFTLQNFPYIEADFDAITNYQLFCKVVEYLNQVIANENTVESIVQQQIDNINILYNWFSELDVQDEINNKLDEMVEDGTLNNIILNYLRLKPLITFDTLLEAQQSTQLIEGSTFRTLGKYNINDGFGAYYKVQTTASSIELLNNLYATIIDDFGGNNYIDEITVDQIRRYDTDCYITTIPLKTINNEFINPHVEYDTSTPWNHAIKTFSTLTNNASASIKINDMTEFVIPIMIGNGIILNNEEQFIGSSLPDHYVYLGITNDRTIKEYKINNTNAQTMLNDGCIQVFDAYYKLIDHGVKSNLTNIVVNNNTNITTDEHPRQCLGVKQDGTIILLTCDGRTGNDEGLTSEECQNILLEYNVYDAWNLDGGGSTSTVYKGSKLNRNIDNNRTIERNIPYTLNFRKETINKELAKVNSRIGEEKKNTLNEIYESTIQNHSKELDGTDLNNQTGSIIIGYGNNITNKPDVVGNGYFMNIPHSYSKFNKTYNKQFFIPRETHILWQRRQVNGVFTEWEPIQTVCGRVNCQNLTLSQTNTYTTIPLPANEFIKNAGLITIENNHLKLSKYLINKIVNIRVQGDIAGSTGNKFISLAKNGEHIGQFIYKFSNYDANTAGGFSCEFTFQYNGDETSYYDIQFYGNQNDVFERVSINISIE